jgi:hypothetical protein
MLVSGGFHIARSLFHPHAIPANPNQVPKCGQCKTLDAWGQFNWVIVGFSFDDLPQTRVVIHQSEY